MSPGFRRLLRPKWLVWHVLIGVLLITTFNLGFWQLRRLETRQTWNAQVELQGVLPPVTLEEALVGPPDQALFRRVSATGEFDEAAQVYVAHRSQNDSPGLHVVTLLRVTDGPDVVVNRGFVPRLNYLEDDPTLWPAALGEVEISGVLVEQTVRSGGLGDEVMGIDLAALSQRWGVSVAPFVLQATDGANVDWLPAPLPEPDLSDGPHLGYALQWFAFTLVGVVGYPLAMANVARRTEEVA